MSLSDAQDKVRRFTGDKGISSKLDIRLIDLVSEVGELSKEVLKGTNYGSRPFNKTEGWQSELGDVLFSLICIANETGMDLEGCLDYVLAKYEKRFGERDSLGSEV
jgi:NTP pyrophosphatase (non-canonical NTP hydrolase)